MPLYKRNTAVNLENVCIAFTSATENQREGFKDILNISGFCYSGSGFLFLGDDIQFDNTYILDAGEDLV